MGFIIFGRNHKPACILIQTVDNTGAHHPANAGKIVRAEVPLSEMFGYATELRSMTQGRASYSMQFDHYEQLPNNLAEEIIAKHAGKQGE